MLRHFLQDVVVCVTDALVHIGVVDYALIAEELDGESLVSYDEVVRIAKVVTVSN